jgi:hypothetical protein
MAKRQQPGCGCCSCALQVNVRGCNSMSLAAGLTVDLKVGGSTIYSGTTDSSGTASISGAAGTYDVVVTDSRTPSRWDTQTFTGQTLTCGGTLTVTMTSVKTGFTCVPMCAEPISDTLYGTDVNGTWTLTRMTYAALSITGWWGCASRSGMTAVTSINAGCIRTTGTGTVPYIVGLYVSGSSWVLANDWGKITSFPDQTSGTPTCSSGALNLNAGLTPGCFGIVQRTGATSLTITSSSCPLSFSVSGQVPIRDTGINTTNNPGSPTIGSTLTVTE